MTRPPPSTRVLGRAIVMVLVAMPICVMMIVIANPRSRAPAPPPAPAPAAAPVIDWTPLETYLGGVEARLRACESRTEALHDTLDTLIGVWPGRAAVPAPPQGWADWPDVGGDLWTHRVPGQRPGEPPPEMP